MKILITGGAGFIGSHLTEALLTDGHQVLVIDNFSTGFVENIPQGVEYLAADIVDAHTASWVQAQEFDVIYHLAAQLDVRKSVQDPLYDARVNVLGSLNLLEAAIRSGVKKFIFASSGGTVYGEQVRFPADEAHECKPLSPYGITKLTVEKYLYYYSEVHGLPSVALRYANIYGMRQSPHGEAGVVAIFAKKILENAQPLINGDGLQTRDYLFIGDLTTANLLALKPNVRGCFNIGSGIETNVIDLFDAINDYFDKPVSRQHTTAKSGEQRRSVLDAGAYQELTGWVPNDTLTTGLAKTLAWFKEKYDNNGQ